MVFIVCMYVCVCIYKTYPHIYIKEAAGLHFMVLQSPGKPWPAPAACKCPRPGSSWGAVVPSADAPLHRLSWGGPCARARPRYVCSHAQGVFTKANRPVFPSPKVFLSENGYFAWYHLVCNRNKRAPRVYTFLPQPACLLLCMHSVRPCVGFVT